MSVTCLDLAIKLFGRYEKRSPSGFYYFYDVGILFNAVTAEIAVGKTTVHFDDFVHGLTTRKKNGGGGGGSRDTLVAQHIAELKAYIPPPEVEPATNPPAPKTEPAATAAEVKAEPDPAPTEATNDAPHESPAEPDNEAANLKVAPEFADLPVEDLGDGIDAPSNLGRDEWNALVDQARASDMVEVAQAHGAQLRKSGGEFVGGCPVCGTGDDRFSINPRKEVFNCRSCGKGGGGAIDLEMFLSGCEFVEAVNRLTNGGPRLSSTKVAETTAQRERENKQYEAKQHRKADQMWAQRRPVAGSPVETYLRARGYTEAIPPTVGYLPARGQRPHAMISALALPNEIAPSELGAPLTVRSIHITKLLPDGSDRIRKKEATPKYIVGRPLGSTDSNIVPHRRILACHYRRS